MKPSCMREFIRSIRSAVSFLTILPVGSDEFSRNSLGVFWVAGVLVGIVDLTSARLFDLFLSPLEVGVLVVAVDAFVTRVMHYDALADFSDGFLPFMESQKRLDVMDDSRLGAFGALGLVVVVLVRSSAFASMNFASQGLDFVAIVVASRIFMSLAPLLVPPAKPSGAMTLFGIWTLDGHHWRKLQRLPLWVYIAMAVGAALTVVLLGWEMSVLAVISVGIEFGAFAAILFWSKRNISGITGDVVGAAGIISETVALIVLAGHVRGVGL